MNWSHLFVIVLALAVGIYVGAKNPSLLSKLTAGKVAA